MRKHHKQSFREAFHSKPDIVSPQKTSILERLSDKIQSTFNPPSGNETSPKSNRPQMSRAQANLINTKNFPKKDYDRLDSLGQLSASSSFSSDKNRKSGSMGRY